MEASPPPKATKRKSKTKKKKKRAPPALPSDARPRGAKIRSPKVKKKKKSVGDGVGGGGAGTKAKKAKSPSRDGAVEKIKKVKKTKKKKKETAKDAAPKETEPVAAANVAPPTEATPTLPAAVEATDVETRLRDLASRLFRALDKDGDGQLSTEEASQLFDADDWDDIISGADEDSDGLIDETEWVEYVVAMGREEGFDDAIESFTEMLNAILPSVAKDEVVPAAAVDVAAAPVDAEAPVDTEAEGEVAPTPAVVDAEVPDSGSVANAAAAPDAAANVAVPDETPTASGEAALEVAVPAAAIAVEKDATPPAAIVVEQESTPTTTTKKKKKKKLTAVERMALLAGKNRVIKTTVATGKTMKKKKKKSISAPTVEPVATLTPAQQWKVRKASKSEAVGAAAPSSDVAATPPRKRSFKVKKKKKKKTKNKTNAGSGGTSVLSLGKSKKKKKTRGGAAKELLRAAQRDGEALAAAAAAAKAEEAAAAKAEETLAKAAHEDGRRSSQALTEQLAAEMGFDEDVSMMDLDMEMVVPDGSHDPEEETLPLHPDRFQRESERRGSAPRIDGRKLFAPNEELADFDESEEDEEEQGSPSSSEHEVESADDEERELRTKTMDAWVRRSTSHLGTDDAVTMRMKLAARDAKVEDSASSDDEDAEEVDEDEMAARGAARASLIQRDAAREADMQAWIRRTSAARDAAEWSRQAIREQSSRYADDVGSEDESDEDSADDSFIGRRASESQRLMQEMRVLETIDARKRVFEVHHEHLQLHKGEQQRSLDTALEEHRDREETSDARIAHIDRSLDELLIGVDRAMDKYLASESLNMIAWEPAAELNTTNAKPTLTDAVRWGLQRFVPPHPFASVPAALPTLSIRSTYGQAS